MFFFPPFYPPSICTGWSLPSCMHQRISITYRSCLFSSLVSRMGTSFALFITVSPSIHLTPGFSLSHFSLSHPLNVIPSFFNAQFLPLLLLLLHIIPFKSYLCLFSFICLSAVLFLPNSALLFLPFLAAAALSCSSVNPSPPTHRLLPCPPPSPSSLSLLLATCRCAASKALS